MGLRSEDVFHVKPDFLWDCSAFDTNFNIPTHIFEVQRINICGQPIIDYHTWVWDGIIISKIKNLQKEQKIFKYIQLF